MGRLGLLLNLCDRKCFEIFTPFIILFVVLCNECHAVEKLNVCVSEECYSTAKHLKASINPDVNPCEDFYEFACGGWKENHPIPLTEQAWNPFAVATNKVTLILRDLLESKDDSEANDDPDSVKSAKLFYKACMDDEKIEEVDLGPLVALTDLFGGWPIMDNYWVPTEFNWQEMLGELVHLLYFQPIVHVDVGTDFKNSSQHIIYVDQPTLVVLRQMLVSPDLYTKQIEAYKSFAKDVAEIYLAYNILHKEKSYIAEKLRNEDFIKRFSREVDDMIQFEIDVAKIMSSPEMRRDVGRLYNKMTIRKLQTWTDSALSGSNSSQSSIDWLKLIRSLLKNTNVTIDYNENIVVREVNYLFNLVKLIQKTPLKTIANYLHWRVIEEYSNDLSSDLRKVHFKFRQIFTGAAEEYPRWKECVRSSQFAFGLPLGYKYTQRYFDDSSKKSTMAMVHNLIETFHDQMRNVSWMDEKTKTAANEKISAMKKFIGFPDWFTDNISRLDHYYKGLSIGAIHFANMMNVKWHFINNNLQKLRKPVDRNEWPLHEPPITVNAFYSPYMNAIIFPAAVLQPPFFSRERPDALNYGGVGVVIGHEITHGFDDMGRQYDKYGNLAQWWTEHTINQHRNKTKCFIDQYGNYEVPELKEILFKTVKLNGLLTVGENMADNGGLRQAYLAYKRSISENRNQKFINNVDDEFMFKSGRRFSSYKAVDIRLPGLEMFSNDQLFFLGFAWNWCESQTKESLLHEVLGNAHSPQKFRVIGSIANSPEFSEAFNCPVGSPMNPKNKCSFW